MPQKPLSKSKKEKVIVLLNQGMPYRAISKIAKVSMGKISAIKKEMNGNSTMLFSTESRSSPAPLYRPANKNSFTSRPPGYDYTYIIHSRPVWVAPEGTWGPVQETQYRTFPIWKNPIKIPPRQPQPARALSDNKDTARKQEVCNLSDRVEQIRQETKYFQEKVKRLDEIRLERHNQDQEEYQKVIDNIKKNGSDKPLGWRFSQNTEKKQISQEVWESFMNTRQELYDYEYERMDNEEMRKMLESSAIPIGNYIGTLIARHFLRKPVQAIPVNVIKVKLRLVGDEKN
jgi:hypothetical protein